MTVKINAVTNLTSKSKAVLEARYLGSAAPTPQIWNPVLDTIWHHKSVRSFLATPLPDGTLEALITAGQSASTSSMLQTWSAVAVQDPHHKAAAAKLSGDQDLSDKHHRLSNVSAWEGQPGKALDKMDMFITATIDAALASQNVALAAQSMGLGICYVGGARNNAAQLCELLKLPDRVIALFGMAIGVPDPENLPAVKPRLALQEVLHKETWDDQDQQENVEMYNWSLEKFYDWRQLVGRQSWATFVSKTLASGDLDGRERIRQVLLDRGFGLE